MIRPVSAANEERSHHEGMLGNIYKLQPLLEGEQTPTEISVPDNNPFTAKSKLREFVSQAETEVYLVDACIGQRTLDCLMDVCASGQLPH